jgi:hypothetical protein
MKTASLGLLEVMAVRVNAGGDAPPDPPSVGDVRSGPPFFVFFKNSFLANERDIIFRVASHSFTGGFAGFLAG